MRRRRRKSNYRVGPERTEVRLRLLTVVRKQLRHLSWLGGWQTHVATKLTRRMAKSSRG